MIWGITASRPDPLARLEGTAVLFRAMTETDLPALFTAIGRPEIFAGGWGGGMGACRDKFEQWSEFLRKWLPWQQSNVYAVCLRSEDDRVIGTTTLGDFDLENESAHVGWTAYSSHLWGSGVNADAQRLLLSAAFTHGFERVLLQTDVVNMRSRAAIERIGAQPEGVLRHISPRIVSRASTALRRRVETFWIRCQAASNAVNRSLSAPRPFHGVVAKGGCRWGGVFGQATPDVVPYYPRSIWLMSLRMPSRPALELTRKPSSRSLRAKCHWPGSRSKACSPVRGSVVDFV